MGCDIHGFIETVAMFESRSYVSAFCQVYINRDYCLFTVLAGVRGGGQHAGKPKGFPADASSTTLSDYGLGVVEDKNDAEYGYGHVVTREEAKKYTTDGDSNILRGNGGNLTFISNPDWHSASWLSLSEMIDAQKRYVQQANADEWREATNNVELDGLVALMTALEAGRAIKTRFTFWFDN